MLFYFSLGLPSTKPFVFSVQFVSVSCSGQPLILDKEMTDLKSKRIAEIFSNYIFELVNADRADNNFILHSVRKVNMKDKTVEPTL